MRTQIIPIGNSKGIRIPKALLEQCGFNKSADIAIEDGRLVITRIAKARSGWDQAFETMAIRKDDVLLHTTANLFDENEWEW